MESNVGLFGWNHTHNDNMRRYQTALVKFMVEDEDFYHDIRSSLNVNIDFFGDSTLRRIAGTIVDIYARYDAISYDALEAEVNRWARGEFEHKEATEWIEKIKALDLSEEETKLFKDQFRYWRPFVLLARIANSTIDFVREPYRFNDGKFVKLVDEVLDLAFELQEARPDDTEVKGNDWTD